MGSVLEAVMLICFGAAWPFAIYRSWKSRSAAGKSVLFLMILMLAYVFGILHKIFYSPDKVVYFYILNLVMISIDLSLFIRNKRLAEMQGK